MHPAILAEITDVRLAERRREAERARHIAEFRREHARGGVTNRWRGRVGASLIAFGEAVAGPSTAGGVARPRQIGGAR